MDTNTSNDALDTEGLYAVKLGRTVPFAGIQLRPRDDVKLSGEALTSLLADKKTASAILGYSKIVKAVNAE